MMCDYLKASRRCTGFGLAVRTAFKADEDFGVFDGRPEEFIPPRDGRLAIFFAGEWQASLIDGGELAKICGNIGCDSFS